MRSRCGPALLLAALLMILALDNGYVVVADCKRARTNFLNHGIMPKSFAKYNSHTIVNFFQYPSLH